MTANIPKRVTTAILQSLGAGVVPRVGLEYIAVGRKLEIEAMLYDIEHVVAEGGASFRIIVGRYGSGKSFFGQLIRNYALQRNFIVADADMTPTTRLTGTQGQGLNLYRELLNNMATRTRPDGNAFAAILERWISDLQTKVMQSGFKPTDAGFSDAIESQIITTVSEMEGMVHGFDFGTVLNAYWTGHQTGNDDQKQAALRWLRGEYATKTEARDALGVRVIIDDATWYDYVKLLARFVKDVGYGGLVIFLDEVVNLYKISNTVSRINNYERLLSILNDSLQGKAVGLGIVIGCTPQMVEDKQRGLFGYEALRTRLEESRFARDGLRDLSGPIIRLEQLTLEEIFLLLHKLRDIHALHHNYQPTLCDAEIQHFMSEIYNRIGAEQLLTPREIVRDFITVLNLLHQNPDQSFEAIMGSSTFTTIQTTNDPEALTPQSEIADEAPESPYSNFSL